MGLYFFDTEFIEKPCTIDLISIGMISDTGKELYLESSDVDLSNVDPWLKENVLPHLSGNAIPRALIRDKIIEFIGEDPNPEFWAYNSDYDWVVFCWLFGRMVDLPKHFPTFCRDFKQYMEENNISRSELPSKPKNSHNALADARWLRDSFYYYGRKNEV